MLEDREILDGGHILSVDIISPRLSEEEERMAAALTNEEIDAMGSVEELRAKLKEQVKKEGGKNAV